MQSRVSGVFVLCALVLCSADLRAQSAVPIEQEPAHRLVLQNDHVRVFHVQLPAGATSLWHEHRHDGISVRIADATIRDEPQAGAAESFTLHRGAVSFSATPAAFAHRVQNIGVTPFDNVYVEFLDTPDGERAAHSPEGRLAEFENDRVRVLRRVLAAGDSTETHTHTADTVAVVVTPGRLRVTQADGTERTLDSAPGAVQWVAAGTTHALRNVGDMPVEILDLELK